MGLFSGLFRSRDKPQNRTAGSSYSFFMGGSTAGKAVTERSAMQMTAVYSCVRILAEAVAGLPLHLYKYTAEGGKEKAIDHPLYLLLHDEPNPEKLGTFVQFVAKLGYKIKTTSRKTLADSFNKLFVDIEGKGEQNMIDSIAIRTMSKAYYSTDNIGHYGLGFPYYTHFTSPIRRYPDLMVHRALTALLAEDTAMLKRLEKYRKAMEILCE